MKLSHLACPTLLLAGALAAVPALAASNNTTDNSADSATVTFPSHRQYVGIDGSYLQLDDDRNLKDHAGGYGAFYGYQLSKHFWWETEGSFYKLPTDLTSGYQDFYQYHLMTGLSYAFGDRTGFTPYLIAQVGAIKHEVRPTSDNDTNFGANAGVGVVTGPLLDNGLKLRADARYVYDTFDGAHKVKSYGNGDFGDVRFSVGIEFPLGRTRVITKEKTVYQTKVVNVEKPFVDTDGDGVPDSRDQCPNTIPGAKVDSVGCMILNQTIILQNILFQFDKAKLTSASESNLSTVAKSLNTLKAKNDVEIEIAGYTDSVGSNSYNLALSDRRAASVRSYLVAHGVSASMLTSHGYGEANPVASNSTDTGRAMNRRVELHVQQKDQ